MTLLTAVAATLAVGALAAVVGAPLALIAVFAATVFVAAVALRGFVSRGTVRPTVAEFLLATVDALSPPAICCFFLVGVYFAADIAARLVAWLLSLVGIHWGHHEVVVIFAAIFGVLYGVVTIVITLEAMREKLYPDVAGVPSAYHELATRRGRVILTVLFGLVFPAAAVALLLATGAASWPGYVLLLYMILVSTTASPPDAVLLDTASDEAIDALAASFGESGYDVVMHPRTGEAEVDPLLVDVDMFAQKGPRRFAVQVKQREGESAAEPLPWSAATGLATAARVLELDLQASGPAEPEPTSPPSVPERVEPVLVLVGLEPDSSLNAFSEAEHVHILSVGRAGASSSVGDPDVTGDLSRIVERYAARLVGGASVQTPAVQTPAEAASG
jgi:hypothetical protein